MTADVIDDAIDACLVLQPMSAGQGRCRPPGVVGPLILADVRARNRTTMAALWLPATMKCGDHGAARQRRSGAVIPWTRRVSSSHWRASPAPPGARLAGSPCHFRLLAENRRSGGLP